MIVQNRNSDKPVYIYQSFQERLWFSVAPQYKHLIPDNYKVFASVLYGPHTGTVVVVWWPIIPFFKIYHRLMRKFVW